MYLPQNQCAFQTLFISSMGTFLVSGKKKKMKAVIMITKHPKKKKRPNFKWQSKVRKSCPIKKVKSMFTETLMDCPADRISMGNISLGTNHPSGPQDHAKAATYTQIKNRATSPWVLVKVPSPDAPKTEAITAPRANYSNKILK